MITTMQSEPPTTVDPMSRVTEVTDILVVDDLAEKLLVYRTVLENPALNIVTARSGQEALRKVLEGDFAVILLDVSMPTMDGFETAQLIRQRKRSSATPIIFLTAFADDMRMAQGYASGAVDYIPTPVVPEILRAKVQVFVELFQMRRLAAQQAEERAKRASAEEAALRSAFLAEAGGAVSRSLDLTSLLDALVRAPVPFLADLCALTISDDQTHLDEVRCVWRTEAEQPGHAQLDAVVGIPFTWLHKAMQRSVSTGQLQVMDVLPPSRPSGGSRVPDMDGGRALIVPMQTRKGLHGALTLMRRKGGAPYRTDEVMLVRELVSRASIALENVMLVQGIQEADRRKDEFLGMLAHELRNPLAPMRSATELLGMVSTEDPTLGQAQEVIERQVTHMTRLVDDLLDATRIARGKVLLRKEHCDLAAIVRQTAADYKSIFHANGLRFSAEIPEGPLDINGDPTRLAQTVGNLLHNANKFTDSGGQVTLRLKTIGAMVEISVEDTGVGIDPAMVPFVFDVFRQADQGLDRSRGGLGLGLTLVKGLVELHGGTVEVARSRPGLGTTFVVRLPMELPNKIPMKEQDTAPSTGARHRILVIDDNRDAAESIAMLLQRTGHHVVTAFTGPAGLDRARRERPEVVICDIGLPGMDGYQVAQAIREAQSERPPFLIALTGYGREEDQKHSIDAGFSIHMTKPIDIKELRRVLSTLGEVQTG